MEALEGRLAPGSLLDPLLGGTALAVGDEDLEGTALTAGLETGGKGQELLAPARPDGDGPVVALGLSFPLTTDYWAANGAPGGSASFPSVSPLAAHTPNDGLRSGLEGTSLRLSDILLDDLLGFDRPAPSTGLPESLSADPRSASSLTAADGEVGPGPGVSGAANGSEATQPTTGAENQTSSSNHRMLEAMAGQGTADSSTAASSDGANAVIGDYVWSDNDGDGTQEPGEPSRAGVTVNLLAGGAVVQSTMTDSVGRYQFMVGDPSLTYQIRFLLPDGCGATLRYANAADMDSNIDALGYTELFSISSGGVDLTLDAGLCPVSPVGGTIGDRVWADNNQNGIQDSGELGLANVTVNLLNGGGQFLRDTTTNGSGLYQFSGLAPGTYMVEFVRPTGYQFTAKDQPGDDAADSDADPMTGRTDSITLGPDEPRSDIDAGMIFSTNHPPVANDDVVTIDEDMLVDIDVLANDIDADDDPLTIAIVSEPANGEATVNDNGTPSDPRDDQITYTPDPDFFGSDSLTYQLNDGTIDSNVATVSITVNPVDDPPVAPDQAVITDEDTPVDFWPNGGDVDDPVQIMITGGPTHGAASVDVNGTPNDFNDDFITYTPETSYHGPDALTYQVDNGESIATATVSITVRPVNDARLLLPTDQADAEGDTVSLQLETPDNTSSSVIYSATGLPPGLTIDSQTGLISGTLPYTAAQTNDGTYPVSVSASAEGDSDLVEFTWWVADTNRLTRPDDQANLEGDSVSLQIQATDLAGNDLTYGATDLPPGLSIDPESGLITGTITSEMGPITLYPTTISVTGGGATDTTDFTWTVLRGPGPHLLLAINNTLRPEDDITIIDPQRPLPLRVTLLGASPGVHQVELTLTPEGRSTLDEDILELQNGQSIQITIIPHEVSQEEDDIFLQAKVDGQDAGGRKLTNADITYTTKKVRAANTPKDMGDRIPPRVDTLFEFSSGVTLKNKAFFAELQNMSELNGRAGLRVSDGSYEHVLRLTGGKDHSLQIRGLKQTEPGNAGKIVLSIGIDAKNEFLNTDGFSVAAIPNGIKFGAPSPVQGVDHARNDPKAEKYNMVWGIAYPLTYLSDSNDISDLDKVKVSEKIPGVEATKAAKTIWGNLTTAGFRKLTKDDIDLIFGGVKVPRIYKGNRISIEKARADSLKFLRQIIDKEGDGNATWLQYFVFSEERTGVTEANPAVVPNSGFKVDAVAEKKDAYFIRVSRTAKANNGTEKGIIADEHTTQRSVEIA